MDRMNKSTLLVGPKKGFWGGPAGGSVRLAEGSTSLRCVTPATNAAACLAQTKALAKPHFSGGRVLANAEVLPFLRADFAGTYRARYE